MREDLSKHISALDKECFRLDSQKQSYEAASEKQMNYMWEEYEITYNHAMKLRDENLTDLAYMKRQIQELKMRSENSAQSMSMRLKILKIFPKDMHF